MHGSTLKPEHCSFLSLIPQNKFMVRSHLSTLNHKLFELIYQLFLTLSQKNYLIPQQILFLGFAHYFSEHFIIPKPGTPNILPEFDEIDCILTSSQS
jgi:hypothetical protein